MYKEVVGSVSCMCKEVVGDVITPAYTYHTRALVQPVLESFNFMP